jgi:soluble cytochrome b562
MKTILIAMVAALTIVAGCSESSNQQSAEQSAEREDIETVFDPMLSNIDKAKQVEQQVLDQKKKMDEAISRAEQDPG